MISDCHPKIFLCQTKSSSTEVVVDNRTQAAFSWARGGRELSEDVILLPLLKLFLNLTRAVFQKNALLSRCWAEEEDEDEEKRDFVLCDPLASVSSQASLARVWLGDKELVTDTESWGLKHRTRFQFLRTMIIHEWGEFLCLFDIHPPTALMIFKHLLLI